MFGYNNLKDIIETFASFILPIWIFIYQERKFEEAFYIYEKQIDEICGQQDPKEEEYERQNGIPYYEFYIKDKEFSSHLEDEDGSSIYFENGEIIKIFYMKRKFFKSIFIKKHVLKILNRRFDHKDVIIKSNEDKTRYTYLINDIKFRLTCLKRTSI